MNNLADGIEYHLIRKDQPDYEWHGENQKRPCELAHKGQGSYLPA